MNVKIPLWIYGRDDRWVRMVIAAVVRFSACSLRRMLSTCFSAVRCNVQNQADLEIHLSLCEPEGHLRFALGE